MRSFLFWLLILILIAQATQQSDWIQVLENWRLFLIALFGCLTVIGGIQFFILEREYRGKLNDRDGQLERLKTELEYSQNDYRRNLLEKDSIIESLEKKLDEKREDKIQVNTNQETNKNNENTDFNQKEKKNSQKSNLETEEKNYNLSSLSSEIICQKGIQLSSGILELVERIPLTQSELNNIEKALMLEESNKYRGSNLSDILSQPQPPSRYKIKKAHEKKLDLKRKIAVQDYKNEFQNEADAFKIEILSREDFGTNDINDIDYKICRDINDITLIGENLGELSRRFGRKSKKKKKI